MPNLTGGAVGAILTVTVIYPNGSPRDISTATTKRILITQPDGTVLTKTASFDTDGTDGVLTYTTIAGDLDLDGGTHRMRAYIDMPSYTGNTISENFEVDP